MGRDAGPGRPGRGQRRHVQGGQRHARDDGRRSAAGTSRRVVRGDVGSVRAAVDAGRRRPSGWASWWPRTSSRGRTKDWSTVSAASRELMEDRWRIEDGNRDDRDQGARLAGPGDGRHAEGGQRDVHGLEEGGQRPVHGSSPGDVAAVKAARRRRRRGRAGGRRGGEHARHPAPARRAQGRAAQVRPNAGSDRMFLAKVDRQRRRDAEGPRVAGDEAAARPALRHPGAAAGALRAAPIVAVDTRGRGRGRVRALHPGQLGAAHATSRRTAPSTR